MTSDREETCKCGHGYEHHAYNREWDYQMRALLPCEYPGCDCGNYEDSNPKGQP